MNLSEIITAIKMDLGLYMIALPFENINTMIEDVINIKTLKTFSQFSPCYDKCIFDINDLKIVDQDSESITVLLPDVFANREILFVRSVEYHNTSNVGTRWDPWIPYNGNMTQYTMLTTASLHLANQMMPSLTFRYIHPMKLQLFHLLRKTKIVVEFAFAHDKTLASIPNTSRESFLKLATLDVEIFLYESMKHYNDISSAYGNINLKIDDWSNAKSERQQLVDEWANTYHLDVSLIEFG